MRLWRSSDLLLAGVLIAVSISVYLAQIALFADPKSTGFYIFQDLAFLPISVLVVTLVLERLLETRDRRQRLEKLRMLIGTFFSWVGYHLLGRLASLDTSLPDYAPSLLARPDWSDADFARVRREMDARNFSLIVTPAHLADLRPFLHDRAEFMIRLLENPMVLEHETFTELLRAVFHLIEEARVQGGVQRASAERHRPPQERLRARLPPSRDRVDRPPPLPEAVLPVPLLARRQDEPLQPRRQSGRSTVGEQQRLKS